MQSNNDTEAACAHACNVIAVATCSDARLMAQAMQLIMNIVESLSVDALQGHCHPAGTPLVVLGAVSILFVMN